MSTSPPSDNQAQQLEDGLKFWRRATLFGWLVVLAVGSRFVFEAHPDLPHFTALALHYVPRLVLVGALSSSVYMFPGRNYRKYQAMSERAWATRAALATGNDVSIAIALSRMLDVDRNLFLRPGQTTEWLARKTVMRDEER